jgi:hypothetical protein
MCNPHAEPPQVDAAKHKHHRVSHEKITVRIRFLPAVEKWVGNLHEQQPGRGHLGVGRLGGAMPTTGESRGCCVSEQVKVICLDCSRDTVVLSHLFSLLNRVVCAFANAMHGVVLACTRTAQQRVQTQGMVPRACGGLIAQTSSTSQHPCKEALTGGPIMGCA